MNTNDIEGDEDEIATPARLRDWLARYGELPDGVDVSTAAHRRVLDIREGIRALGRANNDEAPDSGRLEALNRAAAGVPVHVSFGPGAWDLQPSAEDVDAFLGRVLGSLAAAIADGSWSRMKACHNDGCGWLFYDYSRNRSGTWCVMAICGSRMKARAYRARQRDTQDA